MIVRDFASYLEQLAPLSTQESYDNSGLLVGDPLTSVAGVLIALDCTEAIVDEAIEKKANLIVVHHPIIFKGIKNLTGSNYVERTVLKAIKNDICIYAAHTNLDNSFDGVNAKIAQRLQIQDYKVLLPKEQELEKLVVFVPQAQAPEVRKAIFEAGGGQIGQYKNCSFNTEGFGTFQAGDSANPFVGEKGKVHEEREHKIEVILPKSIRPKVVHSMLTSHPYEEVAHDIIPLSNPNYFSGAGMYGDLETPEPTKDFLKKIKNQMNTNCVRHTPPVKENVERIAWCGGAGSFLINQAKKAGVDMLITGDVKYHEFFDADSELVIADVGHYESEQFTIELLGELITENFPKFAVHLTRVNTNPINYI